MNEWSHKWRAVGVANVLQLYGVVLLATRKAIRAQAALALQSLLTSKQDGIVKKSTAPLRAPSLASRGRDERRRLAT